MLAYIEHETKVGYKLSVHIMDDGFLMQFVQGSNLVVQTLVETLGEVSKFAMADGFELGCAQLICAHFRGKPVVDFQWQERID